MNVLFGTISSASPSYSGVIVYATPEPVKIDDLIVTDRGGARRFGSGPYFKAVAKPQGIYVDGNLGPYGFVSTLNLSRGFADVFRMELNHTERILWGRPNYVSYTKYYGPVQRAGSNILMYYDNYAGYVPDSVCPTFPSSDVPISESLFEHLCSLAREYTTRWNDHSTWNLGSCATHDVVPKSSTMKFKYGELEFFQYVCSLGVFKAPHASNFSAAYVKAFESLDLTDINTMANIGAGIDAAKAAFQFLKSPTKGLKRLLADLPHDFTTWRKSAQRTWLQKRYVVDTNSMDFKGYKELYHRMKWLSAHAGRTIHSTGIINTDTGSYKAECIFEIDDILPESVGDWLSAIGVEPNLVNLWDMVPYSFIVDWVIPVSKHLDYFDDWGRTFSYVPKSTWFTYMSAYDSQHVFLRIPGRRLEVPPTFIEKSASTTTIKMRIADVVSIFWR